MQLLFWTDIDVFLVNFKFWPRSFVVIGPCYGEMGPTITDTKYIHTIRM